MLIMIKVEIIMVLLITVLLITVLLKDLPIKDLLTDLDGDQDGFLQPNEAARIFSTTL